MKKTIMLFGTFDGLHKGHLYFINKAKKLGKKILIVIARDQNVIKIKNKKALHNENKRLETVQKAYTSAKVILGNLDDYYQPIRYFSPDVIVLGYDQQADLKTLSKNFPKIQIVKIPAYKPEKYKSSLLNKQN